MKTVKLSRTMMKLVIQLTRDDDEVITLPYCMLTLVALLMRKGLPFNKAVCVVVEPEFRDLLTEIICNIFRGSNKDPQVAVAIIGGRILTVTGEEQAPRFDLETEQLTEDSSPSVFVDLILLPVLHDIVNSAVPSVYENLEDFENLLVAESIAQEGLGNG